MVRGSFVCLNWGWVEFVNAEGNLRDLGYVSFCLFRWI